MNQLSAKELAVLRCTFDGLSNKQTAAKLGKGFALRTVEQLRAVSGGVGSRPTTNGESGMTATRLRREVRRVKVAGSLTRSRTVGRKREKEPDRQTPEGQLSLYLDHLLRKRGTDPEDFANAIGVQRSTVFNWLRGDSVPPVRLWPAIAKALDLKDWRSVLPPQRFVDSL